MCLVRYLFFVYAFLKTAPKTFVNVKVTKRDYAPESEWKNWQWRSEGDFFKNGAFFRESGPPLKESPLSKDNTIKAQPGKFVGRLTRNAGQLKCRVGKPC